MALRDPQSILFFLEPWFTRIGGIMRANQPENARMMWSLRQSNYHNLPMSCSVISASRRKPVLIGIERRSRDGAFVLIDEDGCCGIHHIS